MDRANLDWNLLGGGALLLSLLLPRAAWATVLQVGFAAALLIYVGVGPELVPWQAMLLLAARGVMVQAAAAAGGPWLPLPGQLAAPLAGALGVEPPRGPHPGRATLAAAAGGLLSGLGPFTLLLGPRVALLPFAALLALAAWPVGQAEGGDRRVTAVLAAAALASWWTPWVVVPAALVLLALARPAPSRFLPELGWPLGLGAVVWAAARSGLLHQAHLALEMVGRRAPPLLTGLTHLVASLTGPEAGALLLRGALEGGAAPATDAATAQLILGAGAAGLVPLWRATPGRAALREAPRLLLVAALAMAAGALL